MRFPQAILALLMSSSMLAPAIAQHSVTRSSEASVGASVLGGLSVAWVAYEGSEFTVRALRSVQGSAVAAGLEQRVETSAMSPATERGGGTTLRCVGIYGYAYGPGA